MKPESSSLHSQEPATCPYPEPDQCSRWTPSHFLKIHFNITVPSMCRSSKWSLALMSPCQNPVCISPLVNTCYMPCQSHSSSFDQPNNNWWGVKIIKPVVYSILHCPVTLSLLGLNIIFPSILLSSTLPIHFELKTYSLFM